MTANQPDRPARTRPRPAADAGVDPIDYRPSPAAAPTAPVEGKGAQAPAAAPSPVVSTPTAAAATSPSTMPPAAGGPEVTVQLATRISPDVAAILDRAVQREKSKRGSKASKRTLVEEAILALWGTD